MPHTKQELRTAIQAWSKIKNTENHSEAVRANKDTNFRNYVSLNLIIILVPEFSNKGTSVTNNILLKENGSIEKENETGGTSGSN